LNWLCTGDISFVAILESGTGVRCGPARVVVSNDLPVGMQQWIGVTKFFKGFPGPAKSMLNQNDGQITC
jgi:hypothetical protein